MTNEELTRKIKEASGSTISRIEEKGNDGILIKSFYFNMYLQRLLEINSDLILSQEDEILEKL